MTRRTAAVPVVLVLGILAAAACDGSPPAEHDGGDGTPVASERETGEHAARGTADNPDADGEHGRTGEEREHASREGDGEHAGGREHAEGGGEGEEGGIYIARDQRWDAQRHGAHLALRFDAERGAFVGSVRNVSDRPLCAVRVEVHLREGPELGPTPARDLLPGATAEIELAAPDREFEAWTAHPEVSACR